MADPTYDPLANYRSASTALGLTPQEQALYKRHLSNLWGNGGVNNPDGSRSSLFQANVTGPDGRAYNIPTVYGGQILPVQQAQQQAQQQGWNTFPSYGNADQAEARYQAMHDYMDKDTGAYMDVRRGPLSLYPGLF